MSISPRLMSEGPVTVLQWMDTFSAPAQRSLLVETHMTRWLSGERLPWRFCFNRARPLLYDHLLAHIGAAPTLEHAAQHFGTSPATLKRHPAMQGTHFQAEFDLARAHASIHLLQVRGYDNEQVARYLGFHDARNFRRSFRRWTGLTPQLMRRPMLPAT